MRVPSRTGNSCTQVHPQQRSQLSSVPSHSFLRAGLYLGSTEPLLKQMRSSPPIPLSLPAAPSEHRWGSQCSPSSAGPCSGRTTSPWLHAGEPSVLR